MGTNIKMQSNSTRSDRSVKRNNSFGTNQTLMWQCGKSSFFFGEFLVFKRDFGQEYVVQL